MMFKYAMTTFIAIAALISIGCEKPLTSRLSSLTSPVADGPNEETPLAEGKLLNVAPSLFDGKSYFYLPGEYSSAPTIIADLATSPIGSTKGLIPSNNKDTGATAQKLSYVFESGLPIGHTSRLAASWGYLVLRSGASTVDLLKFNPREEVLETVRTLTGSYVHTDYCPTCATNEFLYPGLADPSEPTKTFAKISPEGLAFEFRRPEGLEVCTSASSCSPLLYHHGRNGSLANGWFMNDQNYTTGYNSLVVGVTWGTVFMKAPSGATARGIFFFDRWAGQFLPTTFEVRIYRNVCPLFGDVLYYDDYGDPYYVNQCIAPRAAQYETVTDPSSHYNLFEMSQLSTARIGIRLRTNAPTPPTTGDSADGRRYEYRLTYGSKTTPWLYGLPIDSTYFDKSILDLTSMKVTYSSNANPNEDSGFSTDNSRGSAFPIGFDDTLIRKTGTAGSYAIGGYKRLSLNSRFLRDGSHDFSQYFGEQWKVNFDATVNNLSVQTDYRNNKVFVITAVERDGENIATIQSYKITTGEEVDPPREIDRLVNTAQIRVAGPTGNLVWLEGSYSVPSGTVLKIDPETGTKTKLLFDVRHNGMRQDAIFLKKGPGDFLLATGEFETLNGTPCRHFFMINKVNGSQRCNPFNILNSYFYTQETDEDGDPYGAPYHHDSTINSVLLAESGDDLYLSGSFSSIDGLARLGFARVDAVNGVVRDWTLSPTTLNPAVTIRQVSPRLNFPPVAIGGIVPSQYIGGHFLQANSDTTAFGGYITDTETGASYGQVAPFCTHHFAHQFRISDRILGCENGYGELEILDLDVGRVFSWPIPTSDFDPDGTSHAYASSMVAHNGVIIVGTYVSVPTTRSKSLLGYKIINGRLTYIKDWTALVKKTGLLSSQPGLGYSNISSLQIVGTNLVVYYSQTSKPKIIALSELGI